ncbi:fatty acid elongase 3-like [Silene latifolia]|uniref:fatty acid elongase 3-like n=1 Tax=Silene latifolia TaxID=37657 RepID=UPI003D76A443
MPLLETITYYLVHHPIIATFDWNHTTKPCSTFPFLILTILTYLTLTLTLSYLPIPLPPPRLLRRISTVYNLVILLLSFTMSLATTLSSFLHFPSLSHLFCFPTSTPPRGPVFFWAYVFYLSKILEFSDTFLIILSRSPTSIRRLSFLHVYHHATVPVMCYVWLSTSQSLFPVALVTNASVHTVMYSYYLLCSLGIRPSWKRLVTDCQIIQFVFSFAVSLVMLYYHFFEFRCSGIWGWCFNAVFNASLLYLFLDFHSNNYKQKKDRLSNESDKDKVL